MDSYFTAEETEAQRADSMPWKHSWSPEKDNIYTTGCERSEVSSPKSTTESSESTEEGSFGQSFSSEALCELGFEKWLWFCPRGKKNKEEGCGRTFWEEETAPV